jgi:UDP-N-acetylmuramate--alanine ligase
VVFSTAYSPEIHPQLIQAQEMGLPLIPYHEALGAFSTQSRSVAVTGVHGKTTTTAMIGTLIQQTALSVSVLVGSGVKNFGGKAVHIQGNAYFVAEACEYQRHFLHFSPSILIITSIEADHLDYFRDRADVLSAFLSLAHKLPQGGRVLYCADQDGAVELVQSLAIQRRDIEIIPYGLEATGPFRIQFRGLSQGYQVFLWLIVFRSTGLPIPGRHNVLNAGAAIALVCLLGEEKGQSLNQQWYKGLALGLEDFKSTRRRSEIVHMSAELVVIDDYGHHPTAVKATLSGYREFYPGRRLILSFMHHTYSRTKALYQDWLGVFDEADIVLTHPIYSSAREEKDPTVSGAQFARDLSERHPAVVYFEQFDSAAEWLSKIAVLEMC